MHTLYTYGYNAGSLEDLDAQAKELGAKIVDVRFRASSRDPRWRLDYLKKHFGDSYRYWPSLGNKNYKSGPIELADEEKGLRALKASLDKYPIIIMCGCWNQPECHRTVVAEKAREQFGCEVVHLKKKPKAAGDTSVPATALPPDPPITQLGLFSVPTGLVVPPTSGHHNDEG